MEQQLIYQYSSPLKFLESYSKEDYEFFKGRDKELDRIEWLTKQTNLIVVYGKSGSGKSSIVKCGVVNRLVYWKPIVVHRGNNFMKSILRGLINESKSSFPDDNFIEELIDDLGKLREFIKKEISELRVKPLFILDQFEELFTSPFKKREIERFGEFLNYLSSITKVIICIQSEYLADLFLLEKSNPNILDFKCRIEDPTLGMINTQKGHDVGEIENIIDGTFKYFSINQYEVPSNLNKYTKSQRGKLKPLSEDAKIVRRNLIISKLKEDGDNTIHLPFLQIYLDKLYIDDFIRTYGDYKKLLLEPWNIICENYPLEFDETEIKSFGDVSQILTGYIDEINLKVSTDQLALGIKIQKDAVIKFLKYFVSDDVQKTPIKYVKMENDDYKLYDTFDKEITKTVITEIGGKSSIPFKKALIQIIDELHKARILKKENDWLELTHNRLAKVIHEIQITDIGYYYKGEFESVFKRFAREIQSENERQRYGLLSGEVIEQIEKHNINNILKPERKTDNNVLANTIGKKIYWHAFLNKIKRLKLKDNSKIYSRDYFWKLSKANYSLGVGIIVVIGFIVLGGFLYLGLSRWEKHKDLLESKKNISTDKQKGEKFSKAYEKLSEAFKIGKFNRTKAYTQINEIKETFVSRYIGVVGKKDTAAARSFQERVKFIWSKQSNIIEFELKIDKIKLLKEIQDDLFINNFKYPFYSQSIDINAKRIISTKSRVSSLNKSFFVFAQTLDALYAVSLKKDSKQSSDSNEEKLLEKVSAYEPFNKGFSVLYSTSQGVFSWDWESLTKKKVSCVSPDLINLRSIEQVRNSIFYAINESRRNIHKIIIDKSECNNYLNLLKIKDINIGDGLVIKSLDNLNYIKKIDEFNLCFVANVKYYNKWHKIHKITNGTFLFKFNLKSERITKGISLKSPFIRVNDIKSLQVSKEFIYIAGTKSVYKIPFKKGLIFPTSPSLVVVQDGEISSMDILDDQTSSGYETIIIGSSDKRSRVFQVGKDLEDTYLIKELIGHNGPITNVSFLNFGDDYRVLTTSRDASIKVWNIVSSVKVPTVVVKNCSEITQLKYNSINNKLYIGFKGNSPNGYMISIDSVLSGDSQEKLPQYRKNKGDTIGDITSFDFYSNDKVIMASGNQLAATTDNSIDLRPKIEITGIRVRTNSVALATSKGLFYYEDAQKKPKRKLDSINFNAVDIHPKKDWVIGAGDDNNIYLWNIVKDTVETLSYHTDKVKDVCFSKSGDFFISGSWDNSAMIWELINEKYTYNETLIITSHISDIEDVEFFNDTLVATASSDNTVQLNSIKRDNSKEPFLERQVSLIRHDNSLRAVTFSKDGSIIYTGDKKGIIKRWEWQKFDSVINSRVNIDKLKN